MNIKEIQNIICEICNSELDIDHASENFEKNFVDIGINSLLFVKLLINIEMRMDIEFDEEIIDINFINNLRQLAEYIEKIIGGDE